MKVETPLVYVVILNWNGWEDTLDCLSSLEKLAYPKYEVVVVDNGSTDGSESKIREAYPGIAVLQTGDNLGFAGGNNLGIRYALEQGADFIWFLNNDAVVDSRALHFLLLEALSDKSIGMVGSKIYYHEHPNRIWFAGGTIDRLTAWATHIGMGEADLGQWDRERDVGYVSGCSFLVSKVLVEDIGFLDTRFFLYYEESDWATRAWENGWRLRYQPKSIVWHKVSRSVQLDSPVMAYHLCKSWALYAKKHISSTPAFTVLAIIRYLAPLLVRGKVTTAVAGIRGAKSGLDQT